MKMQIEKMITPERSCVIITMAQGKEHNANGYYLYDNAGQVRALAKLMPGINDEPVKKTAMVTQVPSSAGAALPPISNLSQRPKSKQFNLLNLTHELSELVATINDSKTICIRFTARRFNESGVSQECKTNILQIVQQQIKNITKYSGAKIANIVISNSKNVVNILIHDNGNIFGTKNEMNLAAISTRVQFAGGKVDIISLPGKGCSLFMRFPAT